MEVADTQNDTNVQNEGVGHAPLPLAQEKFFWETQDFNPNDSGSTDGDDNLHQRSAAYRGSIYCHLLG